MPDIGGFGRGLLKGALSATEKAAEKVKDAAEAASRKFDDDPDATQVVANAAAPDPDATQVVGTTTAPEPDPEVTQVLPGTPGRPNHGGQPARRTGEPNPSPPAHGHPTAAAAPTIGAPPAAPATGLVAPPAAPPGDPAAHGRSAEAAGPTAPATGGIAASTAGSAIPATDLAAPAGDSAIHATATQPAQPPTAADPDGEPDDPEDRADASDVRELVDMFRELIAKRRPPAGAVYDGWSIGIGDLLAEHPKVPKRVRGLITKLNRFGGVAFSPQDVVFDGDDVPWEKVTEVRTRNVVTYLVGDAVQQQVEGLPVPWFPGRRRLLDAFGQALLTVSIATAKDQLDNLDLSIPAEIVYKGKLGRKKELGAGFLAALWLTDPAVSEALVATARSRGVTVTPADDDMVANAAERAAQIREKVKALEDELDKFKQRFSRSG